MSLTASQRELLYLYENYPAEFGPAISYARMRDVRAHKNDRAQREAAQSIVDGIAKHFYEMASTMERAGVQRLYNMLLALWDVKVAERNVREDDATTSAEPFLVLPRRLGTQSEEPTWPSRQ